MNDLPAEDYVAPMVLIIWPFMLYSLLKRKLSIPEWDSMLILSFVFLTSFNFPDTCNHSFGGDS